jgi:hypothetical protein
MLAARMRRFLTAATVARLPVSAAGLAPRAW